MLCRTAALGWNSPEPGDKPPGVGSPEKVLRKEGRKEGKVYFRCVTGSQGARHPGGIIGLQIGVLSCSKPCGALLVDSVHPQFGPIYLFTLVSYPFSLAHSTPATWVSLLAFSFTRHGVASGPLHRLCLLPRTLFPRLLHGPHLHFLLVFTERGLF